MSPDLDSLDSVDLVIVRGMPGSGKTELAKDIAQLGYIHLEPNMFFVRDGQMHYDPDQVALARQWCIERVRERLAAGERVVVSGVFAKKSDCEIYTCMAKSFVIVELTQRSQTSSPIPSETISQMARRWEDIPTAIRL